MNSSKHGSLGLMIPFNAPSAPQPVEHVSQHPGSTHVMPHESQLPQEVQEASTTGAQPVAQSHWACVLVGITQPDIRQKVKAKQ
ncbi:MAG: hypothetical protein KDA87_23425 [Planctomycetales bacterium]|nr:hypothetical protein [Planctomycetales bacterium]